MNLLDSTGIGIAFKKNKIRIEDGPYEVVGGFIYLRSSEGVKLKGKGTEVIELPHNIYLNGDYIALVNYSPILYENAVLGGLNFLAGALAPKLVIKVRADKELELSPEDYIIQLAIAKLSN